MTTFRVKIERCVIITRELTIEATSREMAEALVKQSIDRGLISRITSFKEETDDGNDWHIA